MSFIVKNITKSFDGINILSDITFSLNPGNIYSLFGENGSGKTTLFNIIAGFQKANSGSISYKNIEIANYSPDRISHLGIGKVWQIPRICKNLSVQDNLLLGAKEHAGAKLINYFIKPMSVFNDERRLKENAAHIVEEIKLAGKLQQTTGELSFGQQKLLSIGMLLMNDAEVLLLDEPFAGISGQSVEHICQVLVDLKTKNKTIFFIEHNRKVASSISDAMFFLEKGKLLFKEKNNLEIN